MKKYVFFLIFLFISFNCFSQSLQFTKDENNDWVVKTTFQKLIKTKTWEEIQIQNNSTQNLNHVTCSIIINNKEHKMKTISQIKSGDKEEFEGYEDDEMKDELPHYFGKDGKFTTSNYNTITFIINFKEHRDEVIISDVYMNDKKLLFIVEDDPDHKVETEKEALERTGAQTIIIEGKKYLLYEGVVYPIND